MANSITGGSIFNVIGAGSNGTATPLFPVYGATKAGVAQFTKTLNREWRGGVVDIHTVSPGLMATPLLMNNLPSDVVRRVLPFCTSPEIVAKALVPQIRRAHLHAREGTCIKYLTVPKIIGRLITSQM